MLRSQTTLALIALLSTLRALPAWAGSYEQPVWPQVKISRSNGAESVGYRLRPSGDILNVQGPAALQLSCFVAMPQQLAITTDIDSARPRTRKVFAKRVQLRTPSDLQGSASFELRVPAGNHAVRISAPGCVLVVAGADLTQQIPLPQLPLPPLDQLPPLVALPNPPHVAAGWHALSAYADAAPPPGLISVTPNPQAPPASPASKVEKRIRVSLRVGALIPRTELGTGMAISGDVSYALPVLGDRVSIALGLGYALSPYQGAKIIPGRGYDPGFTQNTTVIPLGLTGLFTQRVGSSGLALYGGAGFEVVFVTASFQSFGATSSSGDTTVGVAFEGGLEYPLGPGALTADLRYGEARANLGQAGQDSLGRALLTAGYALRF